jgi:polar amino acid transport system ATP-binding protein
MKLELREVTKNFGAHAAVDRCTLTTEDVHSVVLIGPSGGGKSTLLRIIGGLERADGGSIRVNDRTLTRDERQLLEYRRTVGTVFQAFNLFPHLTALQNVMLPLEKVHGFAADKARAAAEEQLARFRLEAHMGKKPAELSGGQRQRVAIARALAIRPQLLLFDEPTSALDPEMTAEVLEVIEELRRERRDLILVTHQLAFAKQVADRVFFLADGRIVESGGPEIFDQPREEQTRQFLSKVLRY